VALVDWLKARKIDSAHVAHANLELNDLCYVYLKTGSWMKSFPSAESDPAWSRLVVTKVGRASNPLLDEGPIVFSSGPVRVVSTAR
jgi:hypothetical protein